MNTTSRFEDKGDGTLLDHESGLVWSKEDSWPVAQDWLTFQEALNKNLGIMDRTAFTLCMENRMPIMVFDMFEAGNMARAVAGEDIGTWVVPE